MIHTLPLVSAHYSVSALCFGLVHAHVWPAGWRWRWSIALSTDDAMLRGSSGGDVDAGPHQLRYRGASGAIGLARGNRPGGGAAHLALVGTTKLVLLLPSIYNR